MMEMRREERSRNRIVAASKINLSASVIDSLEDADD